MSTGAYVYKLMITVVCHYSFSDRKKHFN